MGDEYCISEFFGTLANNSGNKWCLGAYFVPGAFMCVKSLIFYYCNVETVPHPHCKYVETETYTNSVIYRWSQG